MSEQTDVTKTTDPEIAASDSTAPEGSTSTHTQSHDPAVPEAYAAFMRTGWGTAS